MWPVAPKIFIRQMRLVTGLELGFLSEVRRRCGCAGGELTSHTRGLGGFCGPGGSVVDGRCSRGSREAAGDEGPPLGGECCSIASSWRCQAGEKARGLRWNSGGCSPHSLGTCDPTHFGRFSLPQTTVSLFFSMSTLSSSIDQILLNTVSLQIPYEYCGSKIVFHGLTSITITNIHSYGNPYSLCP